MNLFSKKSKSTPLSYSKHLDPRIIGELKFLQEKVETYNYLIKRCREREKELNELIKEQKKYNRECKKAMEEVLS